ncbi:MAG: aldo/keto reductase, partial [Paludibacteraceae bacterium]
SMSDRQAASDNYVAWARDRGINYFDVAPSYGDAQEKLGDSIKSFRKDIFLACKTTQRLRPDAEREFEQSLKNLHTNYFDVYQLHAMTTQKDLEQAFGPNGTMEMLIKEKQAGRVRKVGITAHSQEIALKALSMYDFDTVMFPLNWQMNLRSKWGTALCKEAKHQNMGILAIKGLIHRRWLENEKKTSRYQKSWCKPIDIENKALGIAALKYTFLIGADVIIPPGDFRNFSFCVDNIEEIINNPLSKEEQKLLDKEFLAVKDYPFFNPAT